MNREICRTCPHYNAIFEANYVDVWKCIKKGHDELKKLKQEKAKLPKGAIWIKGISQWSINCVQIEVDELAIKWSEVCCEDMPVPEYCDLHLEHFMATQNE